LKQRAGLFVGGLALLLLATPAGAQVTKPPAAPPDRDRDLELATAEAAAGHSAAAERHLRDAAVRFHSVRALLQLARLRMGALDAPGAVEALRQARALAPNSEDVLSAYAEASLAAHAPMPALSALDALTRLCPTVARYQFEKGSVLLQAGDAAAAVESLKEAERLEPDQPSTLVALGTALDDLRRYDEAKPHLLRGLSLAPDRVDAVAALAVAEEGLGDLETAEAHARRALAKPGPPAIASLVLGVVMMKHGRCAEARDALLAAVAADPASARAHAELGRAYSCLNDASAAEQQTEISRQRAKETDDRIRQVRLLTGFADGVTPP
jgi:tetratricopeptide (TPR) repeat protein